MSELTPRLVRFRVELEQAIEHDQRRVRIRRRRRVTVRVLVAGGAAASVLLGLLSVVPGEKTSAVDRASAALVPSDRTILHIKLVSTSRSYDGRVAILRSETWEENRPPFHRRAVIETEGPNLPGLEGGRVVGDRRVYRVERVRVGFGGTDLVFDPVTRTIYVHGPQPEKTDPAFCAKVGRATAQQLRVCHYPSFAPGPEHGTSTVTELTRMNDARPFRWRVGSRVVDEREARRLRAQLVPTEAPVEFHRQRILDLLKRKDVRVEGRVRILGRNALLIVWNKGHSSYYVDAHTYDPIELRETNTTGAHVTRFLVYERLAPDAATKRQLDLQALHPAARVNRDPRAYLDAVLRLTAHG